MKIFLNVKILSVAILVFYASFAMGKTADEWIEQGINEKKSENKILSFNKAIEASGSNKASLALSYYNRGVVYYELKEFEKAYADFAEALKGNPDNIDFLKNAGLSCLILRRYDESIKYFEKIIKLQPDSTLGYFLRGNAYLDRKIFAAAIRDYNQIITKAPYNTDFRNNRGWAYFFTKRYAKALEDFDQVLMLNPKDAFAQEGRKKILKVLDKK